MIRNYTTGKTKFVFYQVTAPDGRFQGEKRVGGIDIKTALYEAKQYPKEMIICIFDSIHERKHPNKGDCP